MSLNPLVSVIIPVFNTEAHIAGAIESAFAQTYKNHEIIVVNDGSTDRTLEVVRRFDRNVRLLQTPHLGPSAARNAGIQASQGDYLVFLDADDLILPQKFTLQTQYLKANPQIDVVYSGGYRLWTTSHGFEKRESLEKIGMLNPRLGAPDVSLPQLVTQNAFPIHCAMTRREAVVDCGGFDVSLFGLEDWDFWLRIAERSCFSYLPGDVAVYRYVPGSISYQQVRLGKSFRMICKKIEKAEWFERLPRHVQARFYLDWATQELMFRDPDYARKMLSHARRRDPSYLPALFFEAAIALMGEHAAILYKLKRRILGPRNE